MNFSNGLFKKIKLGFIIFLIALLGGAAFLYQKFFGGKVLPLPKEKFIVGPSQEEPKSTEMKQEKKQLSPTLRIRLKVFAKSLIKPVILTLSSQVKKF